MIQEFEIKRPRGTYGESVGEYFDAACKRFSSIGLMVGSVTIDAVDGVTFAKVNDMRSIKSTTPEALDEMLNKYKFVGLAVGGMEIIDGVITLSDVTDTHDW